MEIPLTIHHRTTTISTIVINSGPTRIVIALLQSGLLISLRILEMSPNLTHIERGVSDSEEIMGRHKDLMEQIKTKQTPVEAMLDQSEKVKTINPEVFEAMKDSLTRAWEDINSVLRIRSQLIEQVTGFHKNRTKCLENFEQFNPNRKEVLLTYQHAMEDGLGLIEKLKEIGNEEPSQSAYSIELVHIWLDELQLRRAKWHIGLKNLFNVQQQKSRETEFDLILKEIETKFKNCSNPEILRPSLLQLSSKIEKSDIPEETKSEFQPIIFNLIEQITLRMEVVDDVKNLIASQLDLQDSNFSNDYEQRLELIRDFELEGNEDLKTIIETRLDIRKDYELILETPLDFENDTIREMLSKDPDLKIEGALDRIQQEKERLKKAFEDGDTSEVVTDDTEWMYIDESPLGDELELENEKSENDKYVEVEETPNKIEQRIIPDLEHQRQMEALMEHQRKLQAELDRQVKIKAELERQAQLERERQDQIQVELEKQQNLEAEAMRQQIEAELELQRQAEAENELRRQAEAEKELKRQAEAEIERQNNAQSELDRRREMEEELERQLASEVELERRLTNAKLELQRKLDLEAETELKLQRLKLILEEQRKAEIDFENQRQLEVKQRQAEVELQRQHRLESELELQRLAKLEAQKQNDLETERQAEMEHRLKLEVELEQQKKIELELSRQAKAELERQRQAAAELDRQHQEAEFERQRQAAVELERQHQEAEFERQRQAAAELERQHQEAEFKRQRQAEFNRHRQIEAELESQRQAETELERKRKIEAELERQRLAQAEMERQRKAELERQRQAEAELESQRQLEVELQFQQEVAKKAEHQRQIQLELEQQQQAEAELIRRQTEEFELVRRLELARVRRIQFDELWRTLDFALPENLETAKNDLKDFEKFEFLVDDMESPPVELIRKMYNKKEEILRCVRFYELVESGQRFTHLQELRHLENQLFQRTDISERIQAEFDSKFCENERPGDVFRAESGKWETQYRTVSPYHDMYASMSSDAEVQTIFEQGMINQSSTTILMSNTPTHPLNSPTEPIILVMQEPAKIIATTQTQTSVTCLGDSLNENETLRPESPAKIFLSSETQTEESGEVSRPQSKLKDEYYEIREEEPFVQKILEEVKSLSDSITQTYEPSPQLLRNSYTQTTSSGGILKSISSSPPTVRFKIPPSDHPKEDFGRIISEVANNEIVPVSVRERIAAINTHSQQECAIELEKSQWIVDSAGDRKFPTSPEPEVGKPDSTVFPEETLTTTSKPTSILYEQNFASESVPVNVGVRRKVKDYKRLFESGESQSVRNVPIQVEFPTRRRVGEYRHLFEGLDRDEELIGNTFPMSYKLSSIRQTSTIDASGQKMESVVTYEGHPISRSSSPYVTFQDSRPQSSASDYILDGATSGAFRPTKFIPARCVESDYGPDYESFRIEPYWVPPSGGRPLSAYELGGSTPNVYHEFENPPQSTIHQHGKQKPIPPPKPTKILARPIPLKKPIPPPKPSKSKLDKLKQDRKILTAIEVMPDDMEKHMELTTTLTKKEECKFFLRPIRTPTEEDEELEMRRHLSPTHFVSITIPPTHSTPSKRTFIEDHSWHCFDRSKSEPHEYGAYSDEISTSQRPKSTELRRTTRSEGTGLPKSMEVTYAVEIKGQEEVESGSKEVVHKIQILK